MSTGPQSSYFKEFFTTEKSLREAFLENARASGYKKSTVSQAKAWLKKSRKRFSEILGQHRFKKIPLNAKKLSAERVGEILREEWLLQTEKDVWMPVTLLIPEGVKMEAAVICSHGHGMAGRFGPAGRRDIPAMKKVFDQYACDYGWKLAKLGFIAACPDARGFGQRREGRMQNDIENPDNLYHSTCRPIQLASVPLGLNLQGMRAWDSRRLVDWLEKDARVDPDRLGAIGLSGGGMQTLNLSALDTRVKAAVVSGYYYGVRESLQEMNENCMCNMVPNLWEHFDMGDLGALSAPRALFIETGDKDPLNGKSGVENVKSQVRIAKRAFEDLGVGDQLQHHVFDGPHTFCGEKSLSWLVEKLG
ncbi:MAG: dienelactone hydrolase family protein [Spirochaetia bacterium]|nr:dienelactone hydrolase family protein [Spirochaetia bacterium]